MSINENTKKVIVFAFLSAIFIFLILIVSIKLIGSINENRLLNKGIENNVYATVSEIGENYIKVKPVDESFGESIKVNIEPNYSVGDFILITYEEDVTSEITPNTIETIAKSGELEITTTISTTKKMTTSVTITNKTTEIQTEVTTKKSSKTNNKDELVLSYVENKTSEIDDYDEKTSFKESAKKTFIVIVDFIFYDGKINGVTWNELSNKAKAKVIYYALLIDNKIDSKWPNYKENLKDKYNDIKSRLIAKYMDITTSICSKHSDECTQTKEDFKLLKSSLSLTWDIIKSAFKYGYEKSTTYLKTWYEVFSGK